MVCVAVPKDTLWPIEPHTSAKHQILRKYLDAWLPILGKYNKRIVYIDGFAGPGQYTGGEPGSPIIALEAAGSHRAKFGGELVFWFIEERPDRVAHLKSRIATLQLPQNCSVHPEEGTFAEKLTAVLDGLDAERGQIAPTFALIDPFGFAGIPYTLVRRLLQKNRCEVLVTFMVDSINRWLEHPDERIRSHITETFGTDEAVKVAFGTGDRADTLKNLYQRQLQQVARFVRYFEMRDKDNRVVYYLFFASNNPLGHVKMKEAMWKVDPMGDFTFSDATDPNQALLFNEPSFAPLQEALVASFRGKGRIIVERVETFVHDDTAYVRKHMGEVLLQLETNGKLAVATTKTDGTKRRAKSFPNDAQVTFL
jgi:three-Cys-motif partner protein